MANAWCINAISYQWCFIQTLQNLDSACIWVWVQFTAPDPLDDKRLDYIKYTDKCWNTCCLTWENEILIYATQWTLKNLTLTNDDANEVVNVKRSDVFWSNRKKTVVRYKTWWYPTSITDWTLAVEELVMNQYSSSWYNVSWLSDWTTYYFSAFAVAQDDTIIDMQSKNITTDFWRKPWVNTIAYYKLETNANDFSWNWFNLSQSWTVNFWKYQNVNCAYFDWWYLYRTISSLPQWSSDRTVSLFVYITKTKAWIFLRWNSSNSQKFWYYYSWENWQCLVWTAYMWTDIKSTTNLLNWRHHIVCTVESSVRKIYIDWQLNQTLNKSGATNTNWTNFEIWRLDWASDYPYKSYQSNMIIEKGAWSLSYIQRYLWKMKSKYWIS